MTTQEMISKRAKLWEDAKNFLDTHTHDGFIGAEDQATFDRMVKDIDDLSSSINNANRMADIGKALDAATSSPILNGVGTVGKNSENASKAFNAYLRKGVIDAALQIGTDIEGGYTVPDEFSNKLIKALDEANQIRSISRVISTSNGDYKIPVLATHVAAYWTDEEGAFQESEPTFGQKVLGSHKLSAYSKVSGELLKDSAFDIQSLLVEDFARAFGLKEEQAFLTGNSTLEPTGILNESANVTAAATDKITSDEILDVYFGLKSGYRKNATWVINSSTLKAIRKLKDSNGQYIWTPSLTVGAPDTILGNKVITSEFMPTIAAGSKTILFGDFSYFWIADRQKRTVQRLNELFALTGQIGFTAMERVDAKVALSEAFSILAQAAE